MVKKNVRSRKHRNMKGGAFTEEQTSQLLQQGLPNDLIERISQSNIDYDDLWSLIAIVSTGQVHNQDQDQDLDNDSLHLSDLNTDGMDNDNSIQDDNSIHDNNSIQDDNNSSVYSGDTSMDTNASMEDGLIGGRHRKKSRKHRKKSRKHHGGTCYGNGVGSNSNDPNFSIYNTNTLKLFPYK